MPHNKVNCLYRFDDGKIWAGTTWGLAIIDEKTYDARHLLYERRDPGSISQNSIRHIFKGDNDIIWVGTYSGGVNFFDVRSQLIRHETNIYENENSINFNIVSSIFEDRRGDLWIGTEYGGVNILDRRSNTYRVLKNKPGTNSVINDNVKSIVEDRFDRKFIATQFGMSIYDRRNGTFFNIDDTETSRGRLNFKIVVDLCQDANGDVWIGTNKWIGTSRMPGPGYLLKYDVGRDTIMHYQPDHEALPIIEGGVNCMIYDDKRNIIWSGGDNGITGFDLNEERYISHSTFQEVSETFAGVVINDMLIDEYGMLWVATFGHGLYIIDTDDFRVRQIGADDGLAETSFYSLVRDEDDIWISTNAQLLKIGELQSLDAYEIQIENYGLQEGFPPQQYFRNAAFRGKDGKLYFGGDDGYISFLPSQVPKIVLNPSVIILNLYVNGIPLEFNANDKGQNLNMTAVNEVTLAHEQSSFSVEFIGPNYINPENTWYQYQLVGLDNDWQALRNFNVINFTELKKGSYELRVRASSDQDNFGEDYTSFFIVVKPAYWATPLAYAIYLVLLLTLLYLFFLVSRRWERLSHNLKLEHLERENEQEISPKED